MRIRVSTVLPDELDPASLRTAIRDAMSMRAGAERIAAGFARAGGAPAAADALESMLVTAQEGRRVEVGPAS